MKKSHKLIIGSLLIFVSIMMLSWNYLAKMRDIVFSNMKISMMEIVSDNKISEVSSSTNSNEEHFVENSESYTINI